MRYNRHLAILVALAALRGLGLGDPVAAAVKEAPKVSDSIIVVFQDTTLPADAATRVQRAGGRVVRALDPVGILVAAPVKGDGEALIKRLHKDDAVLDADYDRVFELIAPKLVFDDGGAEPATDVPHPGIFARFNPTPDWFYTSTAQQWSVKRVGAQGGGIPGGGAGAWDVSFGAGTRIAILDTGVSSVHPDIAPNLVLNMSEVLPFQFFSPCDDGSPEDQHGHGTWTASLAAGALGGGLLIGTAPMAQILNIKVLQRTPDFSLPADLFTQCMEGGSFGLFSWFLQGMLDANANGADVISMSLGGFVRRSSGAGGAIYAAFNRVSNFVTENGSLIVAAAHNQALDLDNLSSFVMLPAQSPNVIAVTATTNPECVLDLTCVAPACTAGPDGLASYSNYGSSLHGLAAPGGDCPGFAAPAATGFVRGACSPGKPGTTLGFPSEGKSFGCFFFGHQAWYVQGTGTSASTPHVAGVAALVKSAYPDLGPDDIRAILRQTAQDIGMVGYDQFFNFGLVDATAAVNRQ